MSVEPLAMPADRSPVASVLGPDNHVLAVIYRHAEPLLAEAGLFVTVITVAGDVDADVADRLDDVLGRAIDEGAPVCCDLSFTGYFGAAGARLVRTVHRRATDSGRLFLLRGVHNVARRILTAIGFDQSLIVE